MGEYDALKILFQLQMPQRGAAVGGHAAGDHRHPPPLRFALAQVCPDAGLNGDMLIEISGQLHPLRDDFVDGLAEMAVRLCEHRCFGHNGMGYALVIGVGIRQPPPGQKLPVYILPDAVGLDQRAVHVE
ncbi:hypothetical protein SDC9_64106 [bioreactor metagenome]|uniref:Uncharacterized protein n=1 Tax=bioreactor metagenome TaxID=1076179 RepID=A0A644XNJ6_9ZZZZ